MVDLFGSLVPVDLIESVALLLGAVVDFEHLLVLAFELLFDGVEDDLRGICYVIR